MNQYLVMQLKQGRINKGMKQSDVTMQTGIKNTTLSNYENGVTEPDIDTFLSLCELYELDFVSIMEEAYGIKIPGRDFDIKPSEIKYIKKYRNLDTYGQETVNLILNRELDRVEQLQKAAASTLVEFPSLDDGKRLVEYFCSASAGTGIFILGNEAAEQIAIPDIPKYKSADYAIKVNGISMEPDYSDGDIVLVSQNEEMKYGDVGIFIVNNEAFIKEYGEKELISRNPDCNNIKISEYDNIVCMGKVIDKLN